MATTTERASNTFDPHRGSPGATQRAERLRRCDPRDIDAVTALTLHAFGAVADEPKWTESGWIVESNGQILGALLAEPTCQFFGRRSLPAAAIGSVVVAPHARGRGVGRTLVSGACDALRETGLWLACLYPTIVPFYRSLGFEIAGTRTTYRANPSAIADAPVRCVEPWDSGDLGDIRACFEIVAHESNGLLERQDSHWEALVAPSSPYYRYAVRDGAVVSGYLVYTKIPDADGEFFSAQCDDLLWLDTDTAVCLLSILGCQRPLLRSASWPGPAIDRTSLLFDQWQVERSDLLWMLRPLDVVEAIAGRGYPAHLSAVLDIDVVDSSRAQTDRLTVEISGGAASVNRRRGAASTTTDVGTFAALFSGWLSPREARLVGRLSTGAAADLDALQSMFGGGPSPWLIDQF